MKCNIYPLNELRQYQYVVILSKYKGKILLSRHKNRSTWETQGGHIEKGETLVEAAKRELYEESGAVEFDLEPLCDYRIDNESAGGMVFTANIHTLGQLPDSEMAEVRTFDVLPENLTYLSITPVLFAEIGCYFYKKATIDDLEILVNSRIQVLRAANQLADDVDMSEVEKESRNYYIESFKEDSHIAYLVYDAEKVIGAGGVSFYRVMPTYHNPSGRKAYIMNMYTHPQYRRKGIAAKTLQLLVEEAKRRGIKQISLEATQMGKPLYQKYGFVEMKDEMEYVGEQKWNQ